MNEIADPYENSRIKNTARWILLPYKYFLVLGIGLLIFVRFLDNRSMVRFMVSLFYLYGEGTFVGVPILGKYEDKPRSRGYFKTPCRGLSDEI